MNLERKYWLEENKDKFLIIGAVITLIGALIIGFLFFNKERNYVPGNKVEIAMADYLLTHQLENELKTVDVSSGEVVDNQSVNGEALSFIDDELQVMYLYENSKINQVVVDNKGEISINEVVEVPSYKDVTHIRTNGEYFGLLTPNNLHVIDSEGKEVLSLNEGVSDVYLVTDQGVYLGVENNLYFVSYETKETQYIDVGDRTTKLTQHVGNVIVRNDFGSGKDTETILTIKDGGLLVDNLKRVPHSNKIDLDVPSTESQLVYINKQHNSDGEITRQSMSTVLLSEADSSEKADEDLDLTEFEIKLDSDGGFNDKAKSIRGFIYDNYGDQVRIIEMRNGREATRVEVGNTDEFVPVYNN